MSIAFALNSIERANLKGAVSEKDFKELINEYFYADSDAESCDDSDSDSDSDSDCRNVAAESVESDDDDETADEPVVSVAEVESVLSSEAVFHTVCESQEAECKRVESFRCNCQYFNKQPCSQQFSSDFVLHRRMQMNELTESKYLDLSD